MNELTTFITLNDGTSTCSRPVIKIKPDTTDFTNVYCSTHTEGYSGKKDYCTCKIKKVIYTRHNVKTDTRDDYYNNRTDFYSEDVSDELIPTVINKYGDYEHRLKSVETIVCNHYLTWNKQRQYNEEQHVVYLQKQDLKTTYIHTMGLQSGQDLSMLDSEIIKSYSQHFDKDQLIAYLLNSNNQLILTVNKQSAFMTELAQKMNSAGNALSFNGY